MRAAGWAILKAQQHVKQGLKKTSIEKLIRLDTMVPISVYSFCDSKEALFVELPVQQRTWMEERIVDALPVTARADVTVRGCGASWR